ncbi:MAG TPA: glycosyltransferase, partial [Thermoleophilia bacterium]
MRVLLTTMRDPGQIGGTSTHIDMLARGLEELGHEVGVLWLGATIPAPVRKAGLVWTAGALNRMRTGWGMVYSAEMRGRLSAAATDRALKKAAAAGQSWDVVNAQEVYSVPGLREAADARGVPLVLTLHGYPLFESVSEGYTSASRAGERYLMRAEMRALSLADAIVTVDTRLYRHALALVPERADRVYTLMNFIDTSAFAPIEDPAEEVRLRRELRDKWDVPLDKVVLFCPRRLVKKNGVVYPSLALAAMHPSERDRFLLLHAGEGGELQAISEAVEENRLEKNVRLLGGQGRDAILELYRLSDIVLVPSVHSENVEEATSLAALEAMASGRPLIAGKVGGLAEMVSDGETGLLVPGDAGVMDPDALAAAILRLAGDREAGARMADAARRYVMENHSHLRAAAAYADIYRQTIQIRATSPALVAGGTPWPTRSVLGFTLDLADLESAAQWLAARARAQTSGKTPGSEPGSTAGKTAGKTAGATTIASTIAVSFNPELVVKAQRDPAVAEALLGADLCYPDGVGAVWAAGRQGAAPERVPGIDLAGRV